MTIVFDMDNTLTDDFGRRVRPGIHDLLIRLKKEGFTLTLWTSSTRGRAVDILTNHRLRPYFNTCIFREDYDPGRQNRPKDIRRVDGWFLVDDDPRQVHFVQSLQLAAFRITPFRDGGETERKELDRLYRTIRRVHVKKVLLDFCRRMGGR